MLFTLENCNYELFSCPFGLLIFLEYITSFTLKNSSDSSQVHRAGWPQFLWDRWHIQSNLSDKFLTNWLQAVNLLLVINITGSLLVLWGQNSWPLSCSSLTSENIAHFKRVQYKKRCFALCLSLDCWMRKWFPTHKTLILRSP